MVQTGMAAPYGGGVFPPPVNGVAGVVGAAGAAGEVKPPPPVPVKEDNSGAPQQPPPSGPQVPPPAGAPHQTAPGAPTAASFSPPPPPNGVDQQAISRYEGPARPCKPDRHFVSLPQGVELNHPKWSDRRHYARPAAGPCWASASIPEESQ
ncbi:hypothetical protein WN48_04601 [Eufriesea mexicana]|nr:hypothetical protein WN48_04601 [Eufriesea mexicana]